MSHDTGQAEQQAAQAALNAKRLDKIRKMQAKGAGLADAAQRRLQQAAGMGGAERETAEHEADSWAKEADACQLAVEELIAIWGVDAAMLSESGGQRDKPERRDVDIDAPYAIDRITLVYGLARALRCDGIRTRRWDSAGKERMVFRAYGFAADLDRLAVLYTSLLMQAATGLQAMPSSKPADAREFLRYFTAEVCARVRAAESRASAAHDSGAAGTQAGGTRSAALVLADRSVAVQDMMRHENPHIRASARRSSRGSAAAARAGQQAGRNADIGLSRLGR